MYRDTQFPCPTCKNVLCVTIHAEVETSYVDSARTFTINDIPIVKCPKCNTYCQIEVDDLYVGYRIQILSTT